LIAINAVGGDGRVLAIVRSCDRAIALRLWRLTWLSA
jgi:hypothetical protein